MKYSLKIFFKLHIRFAHFFIETTIGITFYTFCVLYGLFGCDGTNCQASNTFAGLFALYTFGTIIVLWFLLKFPLSRPFLEELLTKDYIIKYLGKYTVSRLAVRAGSILLSTGVLEATTSHLEHLQNQANAKVVHDMYIADKALTNSPIDTTSK